MRAGFYRLMVYAAIFGALSSLITTGYITTYNLGIKLFEQPRLFVLNVNIWPLILLGVVGVFIGLVIKHFGQHGGLGVFCWLGPKHHDRIMLTLINTSSRQT